MFIDNLKTDFYNRLIGKRILIIVNYDIDAICASKILQALFRYDHMLYSVVPIMGLAGLRRAFNEHKKDIKFVLLVNCGGCVDVVEFLQPEEDVTFFICDSHRPLDVCNIYSDNQICILSDANLEENIPAFEAIFNESDDEDDDDDDDNDNDNNEEDDQIDDIDNPDDDYNIANNDNNLERQSTRKLTHFERHERRVAKARERRKWEDERDRVMFEYTQYSYYGRSSALQVFELAWRLSKDNIDLLWWAIVGLTEQLILGKIESSSYTLELENIQGHVSRLIPKDGDVNNVNATKISFEKDLHLVLYRHWSVIEAMRYSWYCSSKLKLWTLRGDKRLHELLVEMGLPLVQAKQNFGCMDLELRHEFYAKVESFSQKYDISNIVYGSFTLHYGYRNRYAAADYVYALLSTLESVKRDKTPEVCFLAASDALSRNHKDILYAGIDNAKLLHATIYKQVQSSLEAQQVHTTGAFFYYMLNEDNSYFAFPYGLAMLARFLLHGYVATSRRRKAAEMPLVASCTIDVDMGLCLLLGIPPVNDDSPKNLFGKAFEQAALECKATILQDFFDTSIIQIRQMDLTRFIDALTVLMS